MISGMSCQLLRRYDVIYMILSNGTDLQVQQGAGKKRDDRTRIRAFGSFAEGDTTGAGAAAGKPEPFGSQLGKIRSKHRCEKCGDPCYISKDGKHHPIPLEDLARWINAIVSLSSTPFA